LTAESRVKGMKFGSGVMYAGMVLCLTGVMTALDSKAAALDISVEWIRPDLPQPWFFTRP